MAETIPPHRGVGVCCVRCEYWDKLVERADDVIGHSRCMLRGGVRVQGIDWCRSFHPAQHAVARWMEAGAARST